jgi:hypothetical protein
MDPYTSALEARVYIGIQEWASVWVGSPNSTPHMMVGVGSDDYRM